MADDHSNAPAETGVRERPAILRPWLLLGAALAIGFAGIALMFGQPPGVGYALAALLTAVIWVAVGFALGIRPSLAGLTLIALILFYSAMVAVRASPGLLVLNVLMGCGLALLIAAIYLPGRLARMSLTDYAVASVMSGLAFVYQPFLLAFSDLPRAQRTSGKRRRLAPVLWGVALAVPLLLVFGALFAAADAVFANFLQGMFAWVRDYPQLLARLVLSLILSWLALGLARRAFTARMTPRRWKITLIWTSCTWAHPPPSPRWPWLTCSSSASCSFRRSTCSAAATPWHARASPTASTPGAAFSSW
jgi:hypothetical protein